MAEATDTTEKLAGDSGAGARGRKASGATGGAGGGSSAGSNGKGGARGAIGKVRESASQLVSGAGDAARNAASSGKDRASEALTDVSKIVENAAQLVEEKVGATYGGYARKAADGVAGLAQTLQDKDIDELIEDTRNFVRKNPVVAIGAAAALGFVLTRLVKLGSAAGDEPA